MNNREAKQLRGSVRQIAKEVLDQEFGQAIYDKVMQQVVLKLKEVEEMVKSQLHEINQRHKDTMSLLVRQATVPTKAEDAEVEKVGHEFLKENKDLMQDLAKLEEQENSSK